MMCNRATGCDTEPQEIQPSLRIDTERRIYSSKSGTGKALGSWLIPARDFLIDARGCVVQFSPGVGAVCVELEHLLLEVVLYIGSCIFPVKAEAGIVP